MKLRLRIGLLALYAAVVGCATTDQTCTVTCEDCKRLEVDCSDVNELQLPPI